MTVGQARLFGKESLLAFSPSPSLDADVFLCALLAWDKTRLIFHRDENLSEEVEEHFKAWINARKTGLPVAYITGHKEFYGYDFLVTPAVLIPKSDTEVLVEKGLDFIKEKRRANEKKILTICDMCTGSGCVGLSILAECIEKKIIPCEFIPALTLADISLAALEIARANAEKLLGPFFQKKVSLVHTNLFQSIGQSFDIIVSNPPYVPWNETEELLKDGRSEPALALNGDIDLFGNPTGDCDGLGVMRNLVKEAKDHLFSNGLLLVEAGEYNAEMTEYLFRSAGFSDTHIYKDLSGQLRVISGVKA